MKFLKQLFCTHKQCILKKFIKSESSEGFIRLRVSQQRWECQGCFKTFPTLWDGEVTKVFSESLKKGLTTSNRSL